MLPTADESRIDNPATTNAPASRIIAIPDRFGDPGTPIPKRDDAPIPPRPYLPESSKRRWMMLLSAGLTSFGLLGPYLVDVERIEGSWQIREVHWNAATHLNVESIYAMPVMVGVGVLLFAAALCWGRGMRHAGWLKLVIVLSIPIMTTLGLAGLLVIALMTSSIGSPDTQTHVIWTYLLAYPAAMVAFVLNLRSGTRRA